MLREDLCTFVIVARQIVLKMTNVSVQSGRENESAYFIFNNVFRQSCRLWDNVEKYYTAGQVTDDNKAHAYCMLDT
jgi:hypothetical protein